MTNCRFLCVLVAVLASCLSLNTLNAQQRERGPQTRRGLDNQGGQQTRSSNQVEEEGDDDTEQELVDVLAELEQVHRNHIQVLSDVLNKVPNSARAGIERAIERSQRGLEQAQVARQRAQGKGGLRSANRGGGQPDGVGQGRGRGGRPDGVGQGGGRGGRPDGVGQGGGRGKGKSKR